MIRVWHRSLRAAVCLCGALAPGSALAAGGESGAGILFWQALNLTILFAVLWFFARKPLVAWFRERRDRIEGEVESAAKLQREAEERHAHWQRKLAELEGELEEIRRTARGRAETEREGILEAARAAAERIRADARVAIDQELRRAREALRDEASDLSVELAAELLRGQVTGADRDRLIDEFVAKIEQPSTGSGD